MACDQAPVVTHHVFDAVYTCVNCACKQGYMLRRLDSIHTILDSIQVAGDCICNPILAHAVSIARIAFARIVHVSSNAF